MIFDMAERSLFKRSGDRALKSSNIYTFKETKQLLIFFKFWVLQINNLVNLALFNI